MKKNLRIALAQINCTVGDLEGNAAKITQYIHRAKGFGVDIICFPELALTGYPPEDLLLKDKFVDDNLKKLCTYLVSKQYICCITADHGNAEVMFDLETKEKHTAHTLNQVPFIIYDPLDAKNQSLKLRSEGGEGLSYIAGTVLHLMGTKGAKQPFETLLS